MGIKAKYPQKTGRKEKRMPRPRKPLAAQTGHLTKETQETRKYEESLVNAGKDELENIPVALFLDAVAKKEYKRTLENLRKIDLINNLDRAALISYANSYALYVKTCKEIKDTGFVSVINGRPNPLFAIMNQAKKEMETAGKVLGMSPTARLQAASSKTKVQAEELEGMFGDI